MLSEDSFQYAIENTHVFRAPERRIDTFGNTIFRFYLVTELMDAANQVRVRDGRLHAERPQIITPGHIERALLEDFGEKAHAFIDWLKDHKPDAAMVKWGIHFRKTDVVENIVHAPVKEVLGRLNDVVDKNEEAFSAIIQGVDEGWEVCLLKFATDMIQDSAPENINDWRRRGII